MLDSINRCYAKAYISRLPTISDLERGDSKGEFRDIFHESVSLRLKGLLELMQARDNSSKPDLKKIWQLISKSISIVPTDATISSIGSQGFLSVPLFKHDSPIEEFDFIRLHIWHKSLEIHYDKERCLQFSIHSHSFFAESWVLCGQIINDIYNVHNTTSTSPLSLFSIGYNSTLNEINQHVSVAEKTLRYVSVDRQNQMVLRSGEQYKINAGDFHKSGTVDEEEVSATFFSFTNRGDYNKGSFVVGPSDVQYSEVNRKKLIDAAPLICLVNEAIA